MSLVEVQSCSKILRVEYSDIVEFTANAIGAGWGNSGGGFTFIIMIALFNRLLADGMSPHVAWRVAFAIVPVPILLSVATATLIFGTDHPAGRWSDRHKAVTALPESDNQTSINNNNDTENKSGDDFETGDEKVIKTAISQYLSFFWIFLVYSTECYRLGLASFRIGHSCQQATFPEHGERSHLKPADLAAFIGLYDYFWLRTCY
jgi:hypothetical protein